jgi:hypothetical protein
MEEEINTLLNIAYYKEDLEDLSECIGSYKSALVKLTVFFFYYFLIFTRN